MEFIKRHPLLSFFGVLGVIVALAVFVARANESADELTTRALRNLNRGFTQQASSDIARALAIDPDDERALITATEISMRSGDLDRAREQYSRIVRPRLLDEHVSVANAALDRQHFEFAEEILGSVRGQRSDHKQACTLMLELYRMCYRDAEHRQLLFDTLNRIEPHRDDADFLFGLFNPMSATEVGMRDSAQDLAHSDRLIRLTACVNDIQHGETELARNALQKLLIERPDLIEAHGRLGMLLVQADDVDGLREWFVGLPQRSLMHPDCCCAAGVMFEALATPEDALACYRQALLSDYRHQETQSRLIAMLEQSGDKMDVVRELQDLSARQAELEELLASQRLNPEPNLDVSWGVSVLELLMELEWLQEAEVWCSLFNGNDAARFVAPLSKIEDRLAQSSEVATDEVDWPAIEPILRSAGLPPPITPDLLQERQAALRRE